MPKALSSEVQVSNVDALKLTVVVDIALERAKRKNYGLFAIQISAIKNSVTGATVMIKIKIAGDPCLSSDATILFWKHVVKEILPQSTRINLEVIIVGVQQYDFLFAHNVAIEADSVSKSYCVAGSRSYSEPNEVICHSVGARYSQDDHGNGSIVTYTVTEAFSTEFLACEIFGCVVDMPTLRVHYYAYNALINELATNAPMSVFGGPADNESTPCSSSDSPQESRELAEAAYNRPPDWPITELGRYGSAINLRTYIARHLGYTPRSRVVYF
jgi:hypothetical protein